MKKTILLFLMLISLAATAAEQFVTFKPQDDALLLASSDGKLSIAYDMAHEHKGVAIALQSLAADFERVCGARPKLTNRANSNVRLVVGSIDKSDLVKKLVKARKIDGQLLAGKWEKYIITTVDNTIVIAGSDKRGTIYGIYELSRQMGVSPWYWWADVPTVQRDSVFVKQGLFTDGEPAVKYRGIFINDEWPSFGTWANNQFGGINSKMYSKMFELLLRYNRPR